MIRFAVVATVTREGNVHNRKKKNSLLRALFGWTARLPQRSNIVANSVFVVHGRDEALRRSMFAFLRALCLTPRGWKELANEFDSANPDTWDIIVRGMARAQAIVVLLSADETASLKKRHRAGNRHHGENHAGGQARQNVLFEAGLAIGAHPQKTVLVQVGTIRPFSDIAGKDIVVLTNSAGGRSDLARRLAKIGCTVDMDGEWTTAGDF